MNKEKTFAIAAIDLDLAPITDLVMEDAGFDFEPMTAFAAGGLYDPRHRKRDFAHESPYQRYIQGTAPSEIHKLVWLVHGELLAVKIDMQSANVFSDTDEKLGLLSDYLTGGESREALRNWSPATIRLFGVVSAAATRQAMVKAISEVAKNSGLVETYPLAPLDEQKQAPHAALQDIIDENPEAYPGLNWLRRGHTPQNG